MLELNRKIFYSLRGIVLIVVLIYVVLQSKLGCYHVR